MNRKITPKSIFGFFLVVSLAAFLFVNLHATLCFQHNLPPLNVVQSQLQSEKEEESVNMPDVTIIGKAIALVERFVSATH